MSFKLMKKSQGGMRGAVAKAKGGDFPKGADPDFTLMDNEDGTYTIFGRSAAGSEVDISALATHIVSSDNTGVLTVDAPNGMSGKVNGVIAGEANLSFQVNWNDGSMGPFAETVHVHVEPGPVQGLKVRFDPPTPRP